MGQETIDTDANKPPTPGSMTEPPPPSERFQGTVRSLQLADLDQIKPILETWVKKDNGDPIPAEVEQDLDILRASLEPDSNRHFFVAEADGQVVGVIGMQPLDPKMQALPFLTAPPNPIELINAYVARDMRGGRGVGRALVSQVEAHAKALGHSHVVLNSGPRYRNTGWGFYDKIGYERIGVAKDYYAPGRDAPVWQRALQ